MNEALTLKSIFFFMIFWGIGVGMLWFRPRVEMVWKIVVTLIFAFYIWFFWDEIAAGYRTFEAGGYVFTIHFLKELLSLVFVNLFFLWPLSLIIVFYKADALGSERLIKFMCFFTLCLWIVFILYFFYSKGIDTFLYENMKKMLNEVK